jgi:hypothetical protein
MRVPLLTACSGFLLAVLWMDLIFDTQISRRARGEPDEAALASIAGYYRRATTTSRPMSALIALVMGILLVVLADEAVRGATPGWVLALSAVLGGGPILLALVRTVPNATRLGRREGSAADQTRLAHAILVDHIGCALAMVAFLMVWLCFGY